MPGVYTIPATIILLLCVIACSGCTGRPVVHGWLDSEGTIYRQSEQEDFASRTTLRMRGFEF
jgi:hypothetical protein